MPTSLESLQRKLSLRLETLDSAFRRHAIMPVAVMSTDKFALQEGLMSSLWQSWCLFCREVVISSALGAQTQGGVITASPYVGLSEGEIAYISKVFAKAGPLKKVISIVHKREEPTWGDIGKLSKIINGLNCSNKSNMATWFGVSNVIPDLQILRNANAHINSDNIRDINIIRIKYNQTKYRHPSDSMFWIDPSTNDYLWCSWISEIDLIASEVIK